MPRKYSDFSATEKKILAVAQKNIPDSLAPYADIAKAAETTEAEVIKLLRDMKEDGSIRRFGASIKHQRAGFSHNAMVAWKVKDQAQADEAAKVAVEHNLISHCYFRPSNAPDWPYELFTMIHGREENEYLEAIEFLRKNTSLDEYAVLESLRELKKISPTYF